MGKHEKKSTFFGGAAILAAGIAIVKLIGALYKIPLGNILDDEGFGHFNNAYVIYNLLLMVSTAGLPVALSKSISEASTLGKRNQVHRTFSVALATFLVLGTISFAVMFALAQPLADLQGDGAAVQAVRAIAPACFFVCVLSTFRGYAQGHANMVPTAVSQIIEALGKLVIGLALSWVLVRAGATSSDAAAGAIFGVTCGAGICLIYLIVDHIHRRRSEPGRPTDMPEAPGAILKRLLVIAVPITIGSAGLQLLTALETKIYMGQLLSLGYSQSQADTMRGIYSMTQTIYNLPCAFITPITISIIPAITAHLTLCNDKDAKATEESAIRITGLIAMPCAFGLAIMAEPVTALLGGYTGDKLELAGKLMGILGCAVLFNALVLVTTAIMQAHNRAGRPVINMLIGGLLKLGAVYILTGNPNIGIIGTPIGTLLCYIAIALLNLISLHSLLEHPPAILRNLTRSFLSAAIMGVFAYAALAGLKSLGVTSSLILCAGPIALAVCVYALAAVKLKAITKEDCLLLPKGDKIAKLLKL